MKRSILSFLVFLMGSSTCFAKDSDSLLARFFQRDSIRAESPLRQQLSILLYDENGQWFEAKPSEIQMSLQQNPTYFKDSKIVLSVPGHQAVFSVPKTKLDSSLEFELRSEQTKQPVNVRIRETSELLSSSTETYQTASGSERAPRLDVYTHQRTLDRVRKTLVLEFAPAGAPRDTSKLSPRTTRLEFKAERSEPREDSVVVHTQYGAVDAKKYERSTYGSESGF